MPQRNRVPDIFVTIEQQVVQCKKGGMSDKSPLGKRVSAQQMRSQQQVRRQTEGEIALQQTFQGVPLQPGSCDAEHGRAGGGIDEHAVAEDRKSGIDVANSRQQPPQHPE